MWKSNKSRAEQHFGTVQKKDDALIRQKEKVQRERDERMARLREQRLAKEAADQRGAGQPGPAGKAVEPEAESAEAFTARLPKVHPHSS